MNNNQHKAGRGFAGSIGFLLSAIGSAVGLGNIWGFPYKMGKSGGFTFLLLYLALALLVGIPLLIAELSIGRKTGHGPLEALRTFCSKFKWLGWLGTVIPFLIMTFYSVLGGYCIYYVFINIKGIFGTMPAGGASFEALLTNPLISIGVMVLFMLICFVINRGGVSAGVERFNKIGMPALAVMLVIVIVRALTLPNAVEGLKFMFVPGYAVKGGFIEEAPSLLSVLATAGGQMFFSLSLAMGIMVAYGSYIKKDQDIPKSAITIAAADTLIALMAGIAVIPAAVANGIAQGVPVSSIKLSGPNLLFVTLQDVFSGMGTIGGIFGLIFFLLVLIAAISSAISLIEAISITFIDRGHAKGKDDARPRIILITCLLITVVSCLVAADGLGSNKIAPYNLLGMSAPSATWNDCWLDLMDMLSEGVMMPVCALFTALMIGIERKSKELREEFRLGSKMKIEGIWDFCIKFLTPVAMVFILLVQLSDFFGFGWF